MVRKPAVAGQFYPSDATELRNQVEQLLESAPVSPAPEAVAAILVPHAGYPYSGPTAAHAFRRVQGKKPQRVVLLGRSHRFGFSGVSICAEGSFETPLGSLSIDEAFAGRLVSETGNIGMDPHVPEHGLEVELPFLQVALGAVPIVPVLFGSDPEPWHLEVGEMLAALMAPEDLLLISTDLSHFLDEPTANALDRHSIDVLLQQDMQRLMFEDQTGACALCGATAVVAGMACTLARGAEHWQLLDYRTSAAATGDTSRVVGYGAVSMERAA